MKTTTAHTPTPWRLARVSIGSQSSSLTEIVGANGQRVATLAASYERGGKDASIYEVEGNARMLVAAPSLVEALKQIASSCDPGSIAHEIATSSIDSIWTQDVWQKNGQGVV